MTNSPESNGPAKRRGARFGVSAIAVSAFAAALLFLGTSAVAQSSYQPPRTKDGKPDLNGIWQALDTSADWDIEPHPAQAGPVEALGAEFAVQPGLGIVEDGQIPYLSSALAQRKQNFQNRLTADPEVKCYMPGVPRATYMPFPFQIMQTPDLIMITYEYSGSVRTIYMHDPGPAPTDSWMGWSVGHWEGDTWVVDVTGQVDQTWFDRAGDYHSDQLHVIERYTRTGLDTMNYEATIEDPKVFSKPWKISLPLYRHIEKNAQLLEYKCVPFAEPVLYGTLERKSGKPDGKPAGNK
jgi:hypothetical protein